MRLAAGALRLACRGVLRAVGVRVATDMAMTMAKGTRKKTTSQTKGVATSV